MLLSGLNPTGAVFAAGTTASLVGHNILPLIENLVQLRGSCSHSHSHSRDEQRASAQEAARVAGLRAHQCFTSGGSNPPLKPAALLIVDRTEDLLAPNSSPPAACLGHRIVSTLSSSYIGAAASSEGSMVKKRLSCELPLEPIALQRQHLFDPFVQVARSHGVEGAAGVGHRQAAHKEFARLSQPMSAVSSIPLCVAPSLYFKAHLDADTAAILTGHSVDDSQDSAATAEDSFSADCVVLHCIIAGSDEEGRAAICSALKERILRDGGVLPPAKKRGLGAEVMAYVQALVATGADDSHAADAADGPRLEFSPCVCTRSVHLLSIAYAVVESMQRCSSKQFQAAGQCDWLCAYDARAARESELDKIALKHRSFDACIAHILNQCLNSCAQQRDATASSAGATAGPVDLAHVLMQLMRAMALFQLRECDPNVLSALWDFIYEHILHNRFVWWFPFLYCFFH